MPAKREQQLKDFAKPEHKVFPEKRATLHPKKEKTLLSHLLKRAGLADNEPSEPVFPGSEIGKVQPIGEAREKTSLTPVPTQSVGSQLKQPSIVLPQSSKNMSKDQSHIAARESGAPLHTKEPTQSFSKLPDGNIAKPFSKMKQGSLGYSRNTGVADADGEIYVNGSDVELLGKLGFEYSESGYLRLEKTSEVLDVYSYVEKVAGVPKEVAKLIDAGQAFSGEYLKDMGYSVPKGYEVKGDLVWPVEKTEQSFQQAGKESKESFEKTANTQTEAEAWHQRDKKYVTIHVPTLINRVKGRQAQEMNISSIKGGTKTSPGYSDSRLKGTNVKYPIIVDSKNELVDGRHRKIKLLDAGKTKAQVIRINDDDIDACSLHKTAAADPAQTILITGHSGSGKTTLSRQLAEKLGIPVRRVDAHRGWDNYIRGDDKRWKETLTPGTKEHSYFTDLVNRATRDTLKNAPAAGIIEGTQLGHLSPEELAKFKAHIVAGGTRDQSIAQRIQRSVDKASKQGITFSPEEMAAKKIKAEYVANFWEPGVEKFRKLPGVLNYNHSEHKIDPLVEQLKHLMGKQAAADHPVVSSNIKAVGHDKKEKVLDVAFHSGGEYKYKDVPRGLYARLLKVKSPGKFFHKHIKKNNKFEYEKVNKEAEYKWHNSKDLHRDVTNGRHYPFSFLTGEAKELVDAIKNRDMANFKEEVGDTTYAAQMLAAQATGLNHPVYADLSKFHNREKVWKDIFREKGSTYHPKHMEGGSNFAKPSKIIKALASAGIRISQKEAEKLANKYTGGKMEKEAAAATQHYEGESTRPFGGVAGGMSGGVGLQGQSTVGSNQPALRPTPPQLRPIPTQEAPEPVNPAPGSPVGVTNTSPTMSPGTGHVVSTHAPLGVSNVPLGQAKAPSWSEIYSKMKTRPSDFVPDGIVAGVGMVANRIIPGAGLSADLLNKVRRGQAMAQIGVGETAARGKKNDPTGAMIDRIGALGGAAAIYPHPYAKAIGYGVQAGATGINLARDYDQARAQLPDTLTEQPVVPPTNYPASNFSIRPEQQAQPSINTGGDLLAKKGMQTQTYKFEGNVQGVHLRKELHNILDKMRRAGLAVNHPETNEVYATLEGRKKYTDAILDKLKKVLSERKERPLAYGSDYNISHVPSMQEKLKPVKFTKEHLMAFVKRNAEIKSLQSKAEKDQFDFVGKRYRLKPNQHGELEGMVPGKAYDQLINGAPSYSFQIHPQPDILGKQAASIGSLGRLGKALGVKGYGKVMDVARGAFGNFSSLGKSVPPGALHTERMDALHTGNKLLEDFKPDGFKIYSGRVKTPDSLAGHGNQVTNDLLGFRVTPKNGYGEDSANALAEQLRQQGITITKQKKLVRDGYHGWNIAGEMPGANGNVPVEFQMTPRRMQGVFAADHMYNYKPETSGVNPAVSKYIYKPTISYLTKTMSPMSPMQTRVGYGAAGLTGVGGLGAGAYSLARPSGAAPGVTSALPMAQPNTQPIAMGSPQVNVDTL